MYQEEKGALPEQQLSAYIRDLIRADDAAARGVTGDITLLIGLLGSQGVPTAIARNKHENGCRGLRQEATDAQDCGLNRV